MSTLHDVVAVLAELNLLTERDPGALARRDEILATKAELVERIRAEEAAERGPSRDDDATIPCCPACDEPVAAGELIEVVEGRR